MNAFTLESILGLITFFLLLFICVLIFALLFLLYLSFERSKTSNKNTLKLELLEQIFRDANTAALVMDETGHILFINDDATEIFGRTRSDLEGAVFDAFSIVTSSKTKTAEMIECFKDNRKYYYEASISKKGEGRSNFSVGLSQEIIGKKAMILVTLEKIEDKSSIMYEQNMTEMRFNEVEIASGVGFFIYNQASKEMIWSRGFYKLLGAEINAVKPGLDFFNLFPQESIDQAQNLLMSFKNKNTITERLPITGYDGKRRIIELTLKHQPGVGAMDHRTLGIGRDVTTIDALNGSVKRNISGWMNLFNMNHLIFAVTDPNGKIIRINRYGRDLVGILPEEAKGRFFGEFFGLDPKEIAEKGSIHGEIITSNGESVPLLWQSFTLMNSGGNLDTVNVGIELAPTFKAGESEDQDLRSKEL